MHTLSLIDVELLSQRLLTASGASPLQAGATARSIRDAEADGLRTVGLAYLPTYCDHVACGKVDGNAVPTVRSPRAATVVVDAHHGFSHPAFDVGQAPLVDAARHCGIAMMAISDDELANITATSPSAAKRSTNQPSTPAE